MSSEAERNSIELRQIRLQDTILLDIQLSQYVLTPEFKEQFRRIPKKTCKECGVIFRVTHICKTTSTQTWIPNWENILFRNFKPKRQEIHEIQLDPFEKSNHQEKNIPNSHIEVKKVSSISNQPRKKTKKYPRDAVSKQKSSKITYSPPIKEKSYVHPRQPSTGQKQKLSVSKTTQLTQKEKIVYEQLRNWCRLQANRENIQPYQIAKDTTLMAIVYYRVSSTNELMKISGISPETARKYGTEILRIMHLNSIGTGIRTHQQQRKQTPMEKFVTKDPSNNKKIIGGFIACVIFVVLIVIFTSF